LPLCVSDVGGGADQREQSTAGRRHVGADACEVEPEVRIILVALRCGGAQREGVEIEVEMLGMSVSAANSDAIRDDMSGQKGREGVPASTLWIEECIALQHDEQDVLLQIVPIGTREAQPTGTTAGVALGDSQAGSDAVRVPAGGLGWGSWALRGHFGLRRRVVGATPGPEHGCAGSVEQQRQ
jgi:hypothetical protein